MTDLEFFICYEKIINSIIIYIILELLYLYAFEWFLFVSFFSLISLYII